MPDQPRDEPLDHDLFYDGPEEEPAAPGPAGATGDGSAADALVAAVLEAGPEAADHLLTAAQELLLAAKAVVDAGERVVERHRAGERGSGAETGAEETGDEPRVRRIDLA